MNDTPEPPTRLVNMNHLGRALLEYDDPPVEMLFVYNCNPLATMPDQNRVLEGLQRDDLFTVVYEQVFTDTAATPTSFLPATTFLENYDIAKGYGPISLQLVQPVIEPVGEARPNAEVFSELAERLGLGEAEEETDTLLRDRRHGCRGRSARRADGTRLGDAAVRRRARPVRRRLPADARPQGRPVPARARRRSARRASTAISRIRRPTISARADLAGQRKNRLVDARRAARARRRCCRCTRRTPQTRGLATRRSRSACSTISAKCSARSR